MNDTPSPSAAAPGSPSLLAEINFLSELCQVVASNNELQPILDWIVHKTAVLLGSDDGSIKLLGPDAAAPTARTLVRKQTPGLDSGSWELPVATSVMGYLLHKGGPLVTPDLIEDERFPGLRRVTTRVRAVLAVPLRVGNRVTGMLAVTNRTPGRLWAPEEVQLLDIVATNSAGVIEQARLRVEEEEKKRLEEEKRHMDRELDLARAIQMRLVPSEPLVAGHWEVRGRLVPARQVGGDSFDYFPLPGNRFAVAIADVSGKGVPASLLMSNVQASLRAFCDGIRPAPEAIRQVNLGITRTSGEGKFITVFYAEVDFAAGVVHFVNAGHNYPLLRRASGAIEELVTGGTMLGLFPDAEYEQGQTVLTPGDALLLYSDGISEAMDSRGRDFGDDRLKALWQECGVLPPEAAIERLMREVEVFRGSAGQSDDMTALVVGGRPV